MPTEVCERFMAKLLKMSEQSSPFRRWTTGSGAGSSYRHHEHRNMYNKQMSEGAAPVATTNGGGSLLPWKTRGRERTGGPHPPPVTDVVKSSQSVPGQSLCRVVLPDGATSVVGVEDSTTVRRLVDRLLLRRNLPCANYDVLLKDASQGTSSTVELSSPSSVLCGREAVVERRCVVRLELGARGVAVRCGPARRLRHVLRPVLAKYAAPHPTRVVLRDGRVLHPDTLMQELDGSRLQIVEVSENGEYRATTAEPRDVDDDTDSLSDLAVRLQDDAMRQPDEMSVGTASGSSRGSGGGRVRAALRPGPPLHHHPPDFLANLRETQRQMLQNKGSTSPPPSPGPTPRSPPPLPPKPTQRAPPTVV